MSALPVVLEGPEGLRPVLDRLEPPEDDWTPDDDYQCYLVDPIYGRCAASAASEEHHLILRSSGGTTGPTIRACNMHHRWIHPDAWSPVSLAPRIVGPGGEIVELAYDEKMGLWVPESSFATEDLPEGDHFWTFEQRGGKRHGAVMELWCYEQVRARWTGRARSLVNALGVGLALFETSRWAAAWALHELTYRHLWPYLDIGIDADPDEPMRPLRAFADYMGYHRKTFESWVRCEQRRRILPADEQELALRAPMRLMKEVGGELVEMPPERRKSEVWQPVLEDGDTTAPIISGIRSRGRAREARERGQRRFSVYFREVRGPMEFEVDASDAGEAVRVAREIAERRAPFRGAVNFGTADVDEVGAD